MGIFDWLFRRKDKPQKKEINKFRMTETMWGYVAMGAASYEDGYKKGKADGNRLQYEVTMHVDNFKEFKVPSARRAPMTGWVTCKNLFGKELPIRNGEYGLYVIDRETGQRRITYAFEFTDRDGKNYRLSGYKIITHDPGTLDLLEDQTTLFAKISRLDGATETVVAQGIIHYHIEDFGDMLLSMRTPEEDTLVNRFLMTTRFYSFVSKEIGGYFREISPFYSAEYSNLVCAGTSKAGNKDIGFFFFSGAHDKGFPWGDTVSFADIGLVLQDGETIRRFALTEHSLETLKLLVTEGSYDYEGPLYEITDGFQVSYRQLHQTPLPGGIRKVDARISLRSKSRQVEARSIPFALDPAKLDALPDELKDPVKESGFLEELEKRRGDFAELGYRTEIYRLSSVEGQFALDGTAYVIDTGRSLGEGEHGRIGGLRKPTLYYNYFCAIEPEADLFRVQARSGVLRSLATDLIVSEAEDTMGRIIGQMSRMDILVKGEQAEDIGTGSSDRLIVPLGDLLEINNDHFPTGTFQRRIVALPGIEGIQALALEEDMSVIDTGPIGSDRAVTVAAIKDPDRFTGLDRVLEATGFFDLLDKAQRSSGKTKEKFSIIVKPNFSFMYSLTDISTFTDPRLIEHLIDRIYEKGYRNLAVAEAQSTYTTFVTNRDVPTLARYIGLRSRNYKVIDLSEGTEAHDFGGTLGHHEVHPAWKDADFRISFAKNKTHSYAYYTLTIKNIYGALPRKNKFKEYHCNEKLGIFEPTIDFIEAFPIHFGLIDAYFSADGPFGIFADTEPNYTGTVIGGADIVAVDWVGASKMGYDPMISEYMQLAVKRFGKPKISIIGDHATYREWTNVPRIVSRAAFGIMDSNWLFGDFLYSAMVTMDPFFVFKCDEVSRRVARALGEPARKILFDWVRGNKEDLNRDHLKALFDKDQWEYMERVIRSAFE
jgi:uncharacterized protein (DUF362 family)